MVTTNKRVAESWARGEVARNGRGNFTTNGLRLYSYGMLIGITDREGRKISLIQRAPTRITATTGTHARFAGRVAHETVQPIVNRGGGISNTYLFPAEVLDREGR